MSTLNVQRPTIQNIPYCEFRFQDTNNPNINPCKIKVKDSLACDFMFRMEHGMVFTDGNKIVRFQQGNGYTKLDTVVNGNTYPYTLYDSEKQQVKDWIVANL